MNKLIMTSIVFTLTIATFACSEKNTVQDYLKRAQQYSVNNNINSAIVELKNAVRLAPKNTEARLRLGQAYLQQGSYINAEKELQRAKELGNDVRVDLVKVKVKLDKFDEIYDIARNSTDLSDNQYVIVLTYAGIAALNNGNIEKAQDYLGQAITISADSSYSKVASAYLSRSHEEYKQGLVTLDNILKTSPDFSEAILLKGHLLFAIEEFELASENFSYYRQLHPQDYTVLYFEINSLIRAEYYEEAEKIVDELLTLFSTAPLANQYKAQLLYLEKNYKQAKEFAEIAIQNGGDNFIIAKAIAGVSAFQLEDMEQAYNYLNSIEAKLPLSHPVQKILAVVKMKLGYLTDAAFTLNQLEGLTAEDSNLLQFTSMELMKAGDYDAAQALIDKAGDVLPNNANVMAQKGVLLLSQNDLSGIKALEQALKLDPNIVGVELPLALQYIANKEYQKVEAVIESLQLKGDEITAHLIKGVLFIDKKEITQSQEAFNQVLILDPNNITALYNLGILAENEGNIIEGINLYQRVLHLQPGHIGAIKHLSESQISLGKISEVIEFLTGLYSNNKEEKNLAFALAQNLRINKQVDDAIIILKEIKPKDELPISYWMNLGDSYTTIKSLSNAKNTYSEGLKYFPDNYLLLLRLIGLLEIEKQYAQALQAALSAYNKYPNNTRLEMLLAHFELLNNDLEGTQSYLVKLRAKKLNHPFVNTVEGKLALSLKEYDSAVEHFSMAYQQDLSEVNVINLARALKFSGQQQEAENALESYLSDNSNNIRVRVLLAGLYEDKDRSKIIHQYREILKGTPDNFVILNNLAWNLYLNGETDQALVEIEKANSLQPSNIAILESYGVILISNDKYDEGVLVLTKAIDSGSTDIKVFTSLAEGLIAQEKYTEAKSILMSINTQTEEESIIVNKLLKVLNKA